MTVGEIVESSHLAQSTVSHHLRILREGGFVHVRRIGTSSLIELNGTCLERFPATAADILNQGTPAAAGCSTCGEDCGMEPWTTGSAPDAVHRL